MISPTTVGFSALFAVDQDTNIHPVHLPILKVSQTKAKMKINRYSDEAS